MQTYLILSPAYYECMDETAIKQISTKLQHAYMILESKNMTLDFVAFRYDNHDILSSDQYRMLLEIFAFCKSHNVMLLLNLSMYKIETLVLLWLHGFALGIHFKESDLPLLHDNICLALQQSYFALCSLEGDITLQDKLKIIYDSFLHSCKSGTKTIELLSNTEMLSRLIAPLHHALTNYQKIESRLDRKSCPIFASTHNTKDLSNALSLGVNYATISPIFYDKGNKALGLSYLQALPIELKRNAFALGGINNDSRLEEIKSCGLAGFASISYFLQQ